MATFAARPTVDALGLCARPKDWRLESMASVICVLGVPGFPRHYAVSTPHGQLQAPLGSIVGLRQAACDKGVSPPPDRHV
jgi:hypothetical protein